MPRSTARLLLAIVAIAGILRFVSLRSALPFKLFGDERYYAEVAINLAEGRGHTSKLGDGLRPPLHPWILSQVLEAREIPARRLNYTLGDRLNSEISPASADPLAASVSRMLLFQLGMGTLLVVATFLLGTALFERRVGLLAALCVALDPNLIAFSQFLWGETLCGMLLSLGLASVWRAFRNEEGSEAKPSANIAWALGAGLLLGLTALTRQVGIGIAGVTAFWAVVSARGEQRLNTLFRAVLLVVATGAVVAPWILRNHKQVGEPSLGTVGWFAVAEGNLLDEDDWLQPLADEVADFRRAHHKTPHEKRSTFTRARALEIIRSEQPTWIFKKIVRTTFLLLQPDSFVAKKMVEGAYPEMERRKAFAVITWIATATLIVVALAPLGILADRDARRRWLILLVLGAVFGLHVFANATTRFRVPWLPLLWTCASFGVLNARTHWAQLRGWRRAALVAFLLVLLFGCIPHFLEYSWSAEVWSGTRFGDATETSPAN